MIVHKAKPRRFRPGDAVDYVTKEERKRASVMHYDVYGSVVIHTDQDNHVLLVPEGMLDKPKEPVFRMKRGRQPRQI